MQGIEESELFFKEEALPVLEHTFPELFPRIAAGMAGRGSECFGFDDEISRDHDFTTGFAIWLEREDEIRYGFKLQRTYDELKKRCFPAPAPAAESKLGPSEHGVTVIEDFYRRHTGLPGAPACWQEWLYTPEYAFAEATNGKVFMDNKGTFSAIRNTILCDMPEDVRLKKIAARLAVMAQSGQYNFLRMLRHGESGSAAMALHEFVKNAVSLIFLLNFRFAPYYKWQFRALRALPLFGGLEPELSQLLTQELPGEEKSGLVEKICAELSEHLRETGLSSRREAYLEPHAFDVMKKIRSARIRGLHVMEG